MRAKGERKILFANDKKRADNEEREAARTGKEERANRFAA